MQRTFCDLIHSSLIISLIIFAAIVVLTPSIHISPTPVWRHLQAAMIDYGLLAVQL